MKKKAGQLKVILKRSFIGCNERQRSTVRGLGLGKLNSSAMLKDTAAIRGMIKKVEHLVEVEPA